METKKDKEDRDEPGRFLPGNAGGPGNPLLEQVADYRTAMRAAVTQEEFEVVVRQLLERAEASEAWAVKDLVTRLLGPPLRDCESTKL